MSSNQSSIFAVVAAKTCTLFLGKLRFDEIHGCQTPPIPKGGFEWNGVVCEIELFLSLIGKLFFTFSPRKLYSLKRKKRRKLAWNDLEKGEENLETLELRFFSLLSPLDISPLNIFPSFTLFSIQIEYTVGFLWPVDHHDIRVFLTCLDEGFIAKIRSRDEPELFESSGRAFRAMEKIRSKYDSLRFVSRDPWLPISSFIDLLDRLIATIREREREKTNSNEPRNTLPLWLFSRKRKN